MKRFEKQTGFYIADPDEAILKGIPEHKEILDAFYPLILSASGWRKVFAADGNEESRCEDISEADSVLAGLMALSFSGFIRKLRGDSGNTLLLGMDSRYTGPAIADAMTRVFLADGMDVRNLFITAAPEIMAFSVNPEVSGFAYISASHNPVGHNGLKFGFSGGVLGGREAEELIDDFKKLVENAKAVEYVISVLGAKSVPGYSEVLESIPRWKKEALNAYRDFSRAVISDDENPADSEVFFSRLEEAAKKRGIGVIADFNGSARTLSIDREFIEAGGFAFKAVNGNPREISHRIVPEGESLDQCRKALEEAYSRDSRFILGYVPDNDGDRGNLVYMDERTGKADVLQAQEVFALAVLSELAYISARKPVRPLAVAVNGPTSMRIDTIAGFLKTEVFRAEVGEANAVNLARELRRKGYKVRILGEGSNGGNITHPSAVRDPLNTVFSILKLLLFEDVFRYWCSASGQEKLYSPDYTLSDIIKTLPVYSTTSAYEPGAIMQITTSDHALLKKRYEDLFTVEWEDKKDYLKENFDIHSWREINYESTEEKEGFGPDFRTGKQKGGFKIMFSNSEGADTDYIWMRGSGTEPVFRILADCKGNNRHREEWLLNWHREIINRADRGE